MPVDSQTKVAVIGLGYIGLPTAALIARSGMTVQGVDVSPHVVETVNSGRIHIEEVDLDGLVQGVVSRGLLRASLTVEEADVFVIAVPTPVSEDHAPDISYILAAARTIAPVLRPGNVVILESTSPVGTTEAMRDELQKMRPDIRMPGLPGSNALGGAEIAIAYCPERVLPGRILIELVNNDRCIGGITPRCARKALGFYRQFVRGECITTTARSAEMVKLVENSYRDVNIAFANELSVIADGMGIDVWDVIRLANRHPRVNILQPGPGVGGHCIAVDPWFIVHGDPVNSRIIRTAREVNEAKTDYVIAQASKLIDGMPDAEIACLGLAFKPNIDDFRESPAVKIAKRLVDSYGRRVKLVEPYARGLPMEFVGTPAELIDIDDAIERCAIFVVLVDHDVFKSVPLDERIDKLVYDSRGIWQDQPHAVVQAPLRKAG
ncbi:MAG TPA: UDP-N-acetyl-D-mannosamine dehydrogenase [Sphingobium sp.]